MNKLIVGDYTYGQQGISIHAANDGEPHNIVIGKYCSIANNIKIYCGKFNHNYKKASTYPFKELFNIECTSSIWGKPDPTIGNDVWIGENSVILQGVNVGDGAVIACFSVVTKDVPPYSIVAGNPAKVKKYRFEPEIIKQFLELKWWDLPHDYLIKNVIPYVDDFNIFLNKIREYKNE